MNSKQRIGLGKLFFFSIVLLWSGFSQAQTEISVDQRALLMMKVLGYDQSLFSKVSSIKGVVNIGVLARRENANSLECQKEMLSSLKRLGKKFSIGNHLVLGKAVGFETGLEKIFKKSGLQALFICPELTEELPVILLATRSQNVLSLSDRDQDVEAGVSVGLLWDGKKPLIKVNLKSSRQEGAKLSSSLLQIAQVVNR